MSSVKYQVLDAHLHQQVLEINVEWDVEGASILDAHLHQQVLEINVEWAVEGTSIFHTLDGGDASTIFEDAVSGADANMSIDIDTGL